MLDLIIFSYYVSTQFQIFPGLENALLKFPIFPTCNAESSQGYRWAIASNIGEPKKISDYLESCYLETGIQNPRWMSVTLTVGHSHWHVFTSKPVLSIFYQFSLIEELSFWIWNLWCKMVACDSESSSRSLILNGLQQHFIKHALWEWICKA